VGQALSPLKISMRYQPSLKRTLVDGSLWMVRQRRRASAEALCNPVLFVSPCRGPLVFPSRSREQVEQLPESGDKE
jgi:hypothetical protein